MKKKILLADDDEAFLKLYNILITGAGFTFLGARDGEEALSIAFREEPDILILDVDMPKKDGFAVASEIRTTKWGAKVPIVVLTGKDPDNARLKEIEKLNPTYYLVKGDQSSDDFIEKMKEILSR